MAGHNPTDVSAGRKLRGAVHAAARTLRSWVRTTAGALRRAPAATAWRRLGLGAALLLVSVAGVVGGIIAAGPTRSDVGPFHAELALTPSLHGDTEVSVPPLGALHLDSHEGPAHLSIRLGALDPGRTERLVNDPDGVVRASETAVDDVEQGLTRLVLRTLGAALAGALILAALVFRNTRRVAWAGALALAVTAGSLATAVGTFRPRSIEEPRYEGLLVNAPAVVGEARRIANRYDEYRAQLQRLVRNVSRLYTSVSTLPVFEPDPESLRVLHVSDLHLNPSAWSVIQTVVDQFDIDVVVDTGDITDWGSEPEDSYAQAIGALRVPYVFVRGNHDSSATAAAVARQRNAIVLENSVVAVSGLTIAGIGDPRFTPDKVTSPAGSGSSQRTIEEVLETGGRLADTIRRSGRSVDIALVHDPTSAGGLAGSCPLVLAGHTHARQVRELPQIDPPPGTPRTLLMVEGSTGGAGLRGLEGEAPLPLALSVLYFGPDRALAAYDDIRVGGTGLANVTLERHVVEEPPPPNTAPTPGG
ncbi:MAG TPA: metallophosphoesterase [Micromonosporaceae bacterium]|nr:metallophosphoesterase [Micromonosporaceae bacterium]